MKWFLPLLLLFCYIGQGNAGELQWWNSDTVHLQISQQLAIIGQSAFRKNNKKIYYMHYQGSLCFFWTPYILFSPGCRCVYRRKETDWTTRWYSLLEITFQIHAESWSISNRCRAVYRMAKKCSKQPNWWLYRNRTELVFSAPSIFFPYLSEEFFWEPHKNITQNRITFGLRMPYHQTTQLDLCCMLRSLKTSTNHWINQNIIGLHLSLYF